MKKREIKAQRKRAYKAFLQKQKQKEKIPLKDNLLFWLGIVIAIGFIISPFLTAGFIFAMALLLGVWLLCGGFVLLVGAFLGWYK